MSRFPREVDLRQTPHFLFETGSLLALACGVLFILAVIPTVAVTYTTGVMPAVGGLASLTFGLLALLGLGMIYWSLQFPES